MYRVYLCFFSTKNIFGFWPSYLVYTISRFILACSTRGIGVTGFVLATELVGPKSKFLTAIIVQYFFAFGQLFLTRLWINLPTVLFGILSLIAAFLVLMLPETLNRTLPQTIEDTEQMGLTWYVIIILKIFKKTFQNKFITCIRDDQRTSEQEGQINIKNNDHDLNEDRLLNENLKGINDS
ncbi:unnamed protein product [Rotaria sp. Silwood1]|nr:unnamed protein product [Rotaria sp. Silwood1]